MPLVGHSVFFLPFAGGSAYSYRPLISALTTRFKGVPIELPGRGARLREPLRVDIHGMVDDSVVQVLAHVEKSPGERFSLFGHSMGALLAWLTARRLRRLGHALPDTVFVSGLQAPSTLRPRGRGALSAATLREELRRLGGSPEAVLEDDGLYAFFEPIVRADFQAFDAFRYEPEAPLSVPFTILLGAADEVTDTQAHAWQAETTRPVSVHTFPGGHFFLFANAAAVAARLCGEG